MMNNWKVTHRHKEAVLHCWFGRYGATIESGANVYRGYREKNCFFRFLLEQVLVRILIE